MLIRFPCRRVVVFRGHITEYRGSPPQAGHASFHRFFQQTADRLKELHEIQRLFQQGADPCRERREKLVGPGGDQNDRQQRLFQGKLLEGFPSAFSGMFRSSSTRSNLVALFSSSASMPLAAVSTK